MSYKRNKEPEYNSEEDEDFVPDINDDEAPQESYQDDDVQGVGGKVTKKNSKKTKLGKASSFDRPRLKGPFDSEDDLSDPEPGSDEGSEPPNKKLKLEETDTGTQKPVEKVVSGSVEDFYASMMKGKAPVSAASPTNSVAARPTNTTIQNESQPSSTSDVSDSSDSKDPMAFFAMMKKSSSPKPSAPSTATSGAGKLAIPASWMTASTASETKSTSERIDDKLVEAPKRVVVKESYEFAGQLVEVERKVDLKEAEMLQTKKGASGLGGLLDQLKGKNKISTLQKSKLDWTQFTDVEGLEDDFVQNRKDGFLQKQEFLQNAEAAETAAWKAGLSRSRKR